MIQARHTQVHLTPPRRAFLYRRATGIPSDKESGGEVNFFYHGDSSANTCRRGTHRYTFALDGNLVHTTRKR